MKIAVLMPDNETRAIFLTPTAIKALEGIGCLHFNDGAYEPEKMAHILEDSDVCITGWGCPPLDETILGAAKSLRLVVHTGGTVANVATEFLYDQGITVISGNKMFAESVAEGAIAYMLAGLRRIPFYNTLVHEKKWRSIDSGSLGLLDRKVGLVGFGAIARHLVPMLRAFRVRIQVYDPFLNASDYAGYEVPPANSLEEIFAENDIISVHLAQRPETYHLIDKAMLSKLRDGGLIINTARGSIIDEEALADELISGRISAVLDVFEKEPLPPNSRLLGLDNAILIPHMAGPTPDRREYITLALADDIRRFINGQKLQFEIPREYAVMMTRQ